MITDWGKNLQPSTVLQEYPRPQMVRQSYINLNGLWNYAFTTTDVPPSEWDGQILVPFSPEAPLSGVNRILRGDEYLWYQLSFSIPDGFNEGRVLLHFGAVDQTAVVYVNGHETVSHIGGYLPFSADITLFLESENTLLVRVQDDIDEGYHTHGKQRMDRGGMWYTPQSGIWQTVWLESVPESYIRRLVITPLSEDQFILIDAEIEGCESAVAHFQNKDYPLPARIPVENCQRWSPENPVLYDFTVSCGRDLVQSYFAVRKISVEKDSQGVPRIFLNDEPYFQNGLLDQGYWPDGLYTAPSDEALIYDIQIAKDMGFNMLRKHMKVEPLRWYYHCDRLGMLVWQDAPCGANSYNPAVISAPLVTGVHMKDNRYRLLGRQDENGREEFQQELWEMVSCLFNCPCIVLWVPFNEGWGQFDAAKAYELIRSMDPSRLVDHASGWHDQKIGELQSLHVYFRPYRYRPDKLGRAVVLSEFGGFNYRVDGHVFSEKDFGYKKLASPDKMEKALKKLYSEQILPAVEQGLSAAVYTQLSDVEDELNGLLTYDRKIIKLPADTIRNIISKG